VSVPGRPFPWRYPYEDEAERAGVMVKRPVVAITPVGREGGTTVTALVDSGCEHVLAAPWVAMATGSDPQGAHRSLPLGIGGDNVSVQFVDLTLRLHPPGGTDDEFVEWQTEVGFVNKWRPPWPMIVGQVGFFDAFTVTMSRYAMELAVEAADTYDARFGPAYLRP
jgi:hypothetical protein